jgi:hypothetical protein
MHKQNEDELVHRLLRLSHENLDFFKKKNRN